MASSRKTVSPQRPAATNQPITQPIKANGTTSLIGAACHAVGHVAAVNRFCALGSRGGGLHSSSKVPVDGKKIKAAHNYIPVPMFPVHTVSNLPLFNQPAMADRCQGAKFSFCIQPLVLGKHVQLLKPLIGYYQPLYHVESEPVRLGGGPIPTFQFAFSNLHFLPSLYL
jgi:hypothetical protein